MSKSGLGQCTAPSGARGYLHDDGDVLALVREPSSKGAQGWSDSFAVSDTPSRLPDRAPALGAQHLGLKDLILVESDWSAFAKGASKPSGGGGSTTDTYTPQPYTATIDGSNFNIRIEFKGTWTTDLYNGFTQAANLLCTYITGDVPDVFFRGKVIDDIVITAEVKAIDGPGGILGQAGPTVIRTGSYLPASAKMEFDSADASRYLSLGLWDDIVFHEMTHSLGFGTVWSYLGLVDGSTFIGENTVMAYGDPVPLEQTGGSGTAGSHWDEEIFKNELMTGYIDSSNYISDVTWASLSDLGYTLSAYPEQIPMNHPDYLLVA